jgi:hypothetical protein
LHEIINYLANPLFLFSPFTFLFSGIAERTGVRSFDKFRIPHMWYDAMLNDEQELEWSVATKLNSGTKVGDIILITKK